MRRHDEAKTLSKVTSGAMSSAHSTVIVDILKTSRQAGLVGRNKKLSPNSQPNSAKSRQTSGNGSIFAKILIFSLEISRSKIFYLSPCILPQSV